MQAWMDCRGMKPDDQRNASRISTMECTYLPFYVFEVDATTTYTGVLSRTGTKERRSGDLRRDYFWKILGRRSAAFPTQESKLPLEFQVPHNTGRMVRGSRFMAR